MQFGVFTVGDVTPDPTTGTAPSEAERIQSMTRIALKAEDGAQRPLGSALAAFLTQLGFGVGQLGDSPVENSRGEVVGEVRVTG